MAQLVYHDKHRTRLYAVRCLKIRGGRYTVARLLAVYRGKSAEDVHRAALRDFHPTAPLLIGDLTGFLLSIAREVAHFRVWLFDQGHPEPQEALIPAGVSPVAILNAFPLRLPLKPPHSANLSPS